ncbi:MAG: hypothetical protein P4L84_15550 [Isosphaeraceae bacterium]|nr:hypothetical protein [Isosphaeraceae bacterium]
MAVRSQGRRGKTRQQLIQEAIKNVLGHPAAVPGMRIMESAIGRSDSLYATVISERWKDIPREDRWKIILDAYREHDDSKARRIAVAQGLTMEEALLLGVLPFRIVTTWKQGDPVTLDQLTRALLSEGAIKTPSGLLLGFQSLDEAKQAYVHLQERIPGPYWAIVHEIVRPE